MKILIDSREQLPLEFSHAYITETIIQKINVGDYAVQFEDGHIPPFYFERKSIPDLFGTMGVGYERFKECIRRSQESNCTLFIIVEGTLSDVLEGSAHSGIRGTSMVYKLFTIWIRYGIQTIFVRDRREMAEYLTQFFIAVGKRYVAQRESYVKIKENVSNYPTAKTFFVSSA